jgi:hypothetical protein
MQNERKFISPLLYYLLLSGLTDLAFIVVGIFALALLPLKLANLAILIIIILLLWKGALVGFITWFFQKQSHNKELSVKFIGLYFGRFFGIIIGGFLGARIAEIFGQANIIGFIIGALALYFIGRWTGSKVSITIGKQLDKVVSIKEYQLQDKVLKITPLKRSFLFLFIVILPWLLVVIALLLNYIDIPGSYFVEWLPIARIIVIVLSIFAICYPWLMKKRWFIRFHTSKSSPESVISWLGLSLSIVPVVYGMVLFLGMGISIIELCLYAFASSTAAIVWSIFNPAVKEQKRANIG